MIAFVGQLLVGSMHLLHTDDCHVNIDNESETAHHETASTSCCSSCHSEENTSISDDLAVDHLDHHLNDHVPHCTCQPASLQSTPTVEVRQKSQNLKVTQTPNSDIHIPRCCCYVAAAPSIGPPHHIDVGWHSSGKYVATHYCIWTV